jgi:hypothetical protein
MTCNVGNNKYRNIILKSMCYDTYFLKKCTDYVIEHPFYSKNEIDEFGNKICNIELINLICGFEKWTNVFLYWTMQQRRDFVINCMKSGILDLVKICYSNNIIPQMDFSGLFHIPFLYAHIDIVEWLHEINPVYCKKQFKSAFGIINSFITNNITEHSYLSFVKININMSFIKCQQLIHWFANICDDVELILFNDVHDEIPIYTIKIITAEDKLWRKSLRCTWLQSCLKLD